MLFEKIKINKKRLIRKAEFVDGFQHRDAETGMVSLYKNPTDSEISEAKAESMFKAIRGVILENGEIYCWNGDILHDDMSSKTKISMDGNVFRFACENNRWIFDLHDDIPFEIGFVIIINLHWKDLVILINHFNSFSDMILEINLKIRKM